MTINIPPRKDIISFSGWSASSIVDGEIVYKTRSQKNIGITVAVFPSASGAPTYYSDPELSVEITDPVDLRLGGAVGMTTGKVCTILSADENSIELAFNSGFSVDPMEPIIAELADGTPVYIVVADVGDLPNVQVFNTLTPWETWQNDSNLANWVLWPAGVVNRVEQDMFLGNPVGIKIVTSAPVLVEIGR